MGLVASVLFSLVIIINAPLSRAAAAPQDLPPLLDKECTYFSHPVKISICIYKTPGSRSTDVLYYFHGLNGSVTQWETNPSALQIQKYWHEQTYDAPPIVAVSFGSAWLLAEKNSSRVSGLFEIVTQQVMPFAESHLGGIRGQRMLLGESMGGFNVAELVTKKPELFTKAVLACPALATLSPFSPWSEILGFISRMDAKTIDVLDAVFLAHVFFPKPQYWDSGNPLTIGHQSLGVQTPELFISIGMQDGYGFQEGAQLFANLAVQNNVKRVIWRPLPGGHCTFDALGAADFLVPGH